MKFKADIAPLVLLPFFAMSLHTFMEYCLLLWMAGMHVLSMKLIPEHSPKQTGLRNIVKAMKHLGIF